MSRRVPRTLRTLKLDYREIAALLPAPLFLASLHQPARLPPSPPTTFSTSATSFSASVLLRPAQTSSSSTFATSFPESFLSFASPASPLTAEPTWWALLPVLPTLPVQVALPSSSSASFTVRSFLPLSRSFSLYRARAVQAPLGCLSRSVFGPGLVFAFFLPSSLLFLTFRLYLLRFFPGLFLLSARPAPTDTHTRACVRRVRGTVRVCITYATDGMQDGTG